MRRLERGRDLQRDLDGLVVRDLLALDAVREVVAFDQLQRQVGRVADLAIDAVVRERLAGLQRHRAEVSQKTAGGAPIVEQRMFF